MENHGFPVIHLSRYGRGITGVDTECGAGCPGGSGPGSSGGDAMRRNLKIILVLAQIALAGFIPHPVLAQVVPAQPAPAAPVPVPSPAPASIADTPLLGATVMPGTNMPPEVFLLEQVELELKEKYKKEIYVPPPIQSLVFTQDQQALLREARNGFNTKTPVDEVEPPSSDPSRPDDLQAHIQTVRALSLGGIVFSSPDDWTIWLNKKMVTPSKLPAEAVDLRVYKDFIELRWFDAKSNKIFPIRLRPNQTFNLDAQTFIPG